jgi:hypothetical protein
MQAVSVPTELIIIGRNQNVAVIPAAQVTKSTAQRSAAYLRRKSKQIAFIDRIVVSVGIEIDRTTAKQERVFAQEPASFGIQITRPEEVVAGLVFDCDQYWRATNLILAMSTVSQSLANALTN